MELKITEIRNVLTRTSGFLRTVTSHSLQPYRGCTFGNSLCGVGCYVRHNGHVMRGRPWGSFLEVRAGASGSYLANVARERRWARKSQGRFSIFMSSSTDPFLPQEFTQGVTRSVLEAMCDDPPDNLVLQTHTAKVMRYLPLLKRVAGITDLRIHLSLETDRESIPGLPPHGSPIRARIAALKELHASGLFVVATVAPLLPIRDPETFFATLAGASSAIVIDHFIDGDGSAGGARTLRTGLPAAIASVDRDCLSLEYREAMVRIARRHHPGRVGINIDGFAGRYL